MGEQRYGYLVGPIWCYLLLASLIAPQVTSSSIRNEQNVCLTKGCVIAANKIIEKMDDTANPCEDFQRFACGSYLDKTIIPDDKTKLSQFSAISDELEQNLRTLLEEEIKDHDSKATKLVKTHFNTCMDTARIEERGLAPLQETLAQLGGWPVVEGDSWKPSHYRWTYNLYDNKNLGYSFNTLFELEIFNDLRNSSWRILSIDQPGLGMPGKDYLLKNFSDSDIQAYYNYQLGIAELLGADRKRAEIELKQIVEFEAEIAKISLSPAEQRNKSALYNKVTLYDLQLLVPEIPWYEYINRIISPHFAVRANEPIVIYSTDFLKNMGKLINRTPKRTLANYIIWRTIKSSVPNLNQAALDLELEYNKKLRGLKKEKPRWKKCVQKITSRYGRLTIAIGSLYVPKYFKEEAKHAADEMVTYIQEAFNDILHSIDWMDEATRQRALDKSDSIYTSIAYPPELLDDSKVNAYYDGLIFTGGDLLEQQRNMTKFTVTSIIRELRDKVDKRDWRDVGGAAIVNAFYSPIRNAIIFPAGILQGVFFGAERPKYLNFGGIGYVIGHEITHGFDDTGKQFAANGDLRNWWERETENKYLEKAQCIIDQYGNFTLPEIGLNVKGKQTQGENIADNGGIKEAYYGYKKWVADNGEEALLPGLPYTPSQLFWLSAANVWCGKSTPGALKERVLTGAHSPSRFRINGPMMNSQDFAKDFKCPPGSPMNPEEKCKVW